MSARPLPGVRRTLRLHYPGGKVVTEPLTRFGAANGVDRAGALDLIRQWVANGSLRARPDGGFDVLRHQPRRRTQT